MGRRHLVFVIVAAATAWGLACAPASNDAAESNDDALKTGGKVGPHRPLRPIDPAAPIGTIVVGPLSCDVTRFDLRRVTRVCEDLPGAYVENGVTYVPGEGGRFEVRRTLAGTTAPPSLQEKTCTYTWQPQSCELPDTDKLLVEEPTEQLVPRRPGCERLGPAGCMIKTPPPRVDAGVIPTGLGRCEVCGFAADNHLWAVLPTDWTAFSYWAGGERHYVELASPQDLYMVELGSSVAPQNVTLWKSDGAPLEAP